MEHPNNKYIAGATKEQLKNTLHYVEIAIDSWKRNKYNTSRTKADKELQFFTDEKVLIERELKKEG